jgi:hypothetical protein
VILWDALFMLCEIISGQLLMVDDSSPIEITDKRSAIQSLILSQLRVTCGLPGEALYNVVRLAEAAS